MTKKAPEETPDPQSFLPLTPAVFHIMLSLAIGEGHGYGIMLEVERLTSGRLNLGPGTLYRSIQRMLLDGLIEETKDEESEEDDERRRYYRLTRFGLDVAREESRRLEALVRCRSRAKVVAVGENEVSFLFGRPMMSDKVSKVLEDFHTTITPHLTVRRVSTRRSKFYEKAFQGLRALSQRRASTASRSCMSSCCSVTRDSSSHDEFPDHGQLSPPGRSSHGRGTAPLRRRRRQPVSAGRRRRRDRAHALARTAFGAIATPSSSILSAIADRWRPRLEDLSPRQIRERASEFNAQHRERPGESPKH